ncbi:diacylglycerol/lipid kinase family protein [Lacicoccus qingdaonensis]|uniref:Diacylglycerol kinase (ATP) n=1 Tax=Lacicoccus qingdaonensis TaxID=576118 RepID=A0A1G9B959_9BACL|nr:YegS/Rv2252/BmrU family lipid kinase [Salinicoccus qingdaonensis]SDK36028.1 diacylglycerol kinase (ATP) [Salinicoccus qingdaonensis]
MKKALAIINKKAGQRRNGSLEEQLIRQLNAQNFEVMIKYTPEDGAEGITRRYACGKDLIIIAGGDGTIGEVIKGMCLEELQIPIGIIPTGTVNDLARVHKIPLDAKKAIGRIDAENTYSSDTIKMNDTYAGYLIALGSFMTAFAKIGSGMKSKIGRFAYLFAGINMLLKLKKYKVNIKTDNEEFETDAHLTIVTTMSSVGSLTRLIENAEIDDGLLHIINIEPVNLVEAVHIMFLAVTGKIADHPKVNYLISENVEISVIGLKDMNIDGDLHDYADASITVMKRRITLLDLGK